MYKEVAAPMLTTVPPRRSSMKSVRPKLIPTLICLGVVALVATLLPYPGFKSQVTVIDTVSSTPSGK
jgi:hypothetical protein